MQTYLVVKSLHIIFVVSWFAALFYMVRLFIYHVEADSRPEAEKQVLQPQLRIMQRRLWYIIGWPAMILTLVFGIWMLVLNPALLDLRWMQIKLGMVLALLAYHVFCQVILQKQASGTFTWRSMHLRLWNEVATLFLVAIVFVVILKSSMDWVYGVLGFFGTAVVLMLGIQAYKRFRKT
jgi:putative membrane protein